MPHDAELKDKAMKTFSVHIVCRKEELVEDKEIQQSLRSLGAVSGPRFIVENLRSYLFIGHEED